jgi:hypothetical protein
VFALLQGERVAVRKRTGRPAGGTLELPNSPGIWTSVHFTQTLSARCAAPTGNIVH